MTFCRRIHYGRRLPFRHSTLQHWKIKKKKVQTSRKIKEINSIPPAVVSILYLQYFYSSFPLKFYHLIDIFVVNFIQSARSLAMSTNCERIHETIDFVLVQYWGWLNLGRFASQTSNCFAREVVYKKFILVFSIVSRQF